MWFIYLSQVALKPVRPVTLLSSFLLKYHKLFIAFRKRRRVLIVKMTLIQNFFVIFFFRYENNY